MTTEYQQTDWYLALKKEVERTSQSRVGSKCGISTTYVNWLLKGTYETNGGNIENVAEKISGALLEQSVNCPVLDVITTDICAQHRNSAFSPHNPMRVRLYRACQNCPNNPKNIGEVQS